MLTTTENPTQAGQPSGLSLIAGSAVFDGHIYTHSMHQDIYALCQEIEKLPASEQQTKCVTAAAKLQDAVANLRTIAAFETKCLRKYAEMCFPEVVNDQKHFARVLMEGVAEELESVFNPPSISSQNIPAQPTARTDARIQK